LKEAGLTGGETVGGLREQSRGEKIICWRLLAQTQQADATGGPTGRWLGFFRTLQKTPKENKAMG